MKENKKTHKWSSIFSIVKIISNFLLGTTAVLVLYIPLKSFFETSENLTSLHKDIITIALIIITALLTTLIHIFLINKFYDTLSTFFYIKNELHTIVSLKEAGFLKKLFEPQYLKENAWISMSNINSLPPEIRRKTIIETAKKIYDKKIDIKKVGEKV